MRHRGCLHRKSYRRSICSRHQEIKLSAFSIVVRSSIIYFLMLPQMRILQELMTFFQFLSISLSRQTHNNFIPTCCMSNIRRQTRLVGETSYFFTNVLSAESFILNIDAKAISLDETEFEQNMESARALLFGLSGEGTGQGHQDGGNLAETDMQKSMSPESSGAESRSDELQIRGRESLGKIPSASDLESKGATMIMKHEDINQVFQEFPYFLSRAGDLTISDVEDLL
ncbi:hypothetical protein Leryth_026137 [Lithospermum erythrorhizon]|nr:hypothetical protein Leryth_026137 [Lithospermum erythrorhizon]